MTIPETVLDIKSRPVRVAYGLVLVPFALLMSMLIGAVCGAFVAVEQFIVPLWHGRE